MKSIFILFCVLLFCSKFVESVPFTEGLIGQRAYQPPTWPVNQNAPALNSFTRTQNGNPITNSRLQNDNDREYFAAQRGHNYDDYGYNPTSLPSAKFPIEDGQRLNSYPTKLNSYPPGIDVPQVGFDNEQYGNQNWKSQNQFIRTAASGVAAQQKTPQISPIQYAPQYNPQSNQPFYQPDRTYPTREQYQYPLGGNFDNNRFDTKNAPHTGSSGLSYENHGVTHGTSSGTTAIKSGPNYNGGPVAITDPAGKVKNDDYDSVYNKDSSSMTAVNNNNRNIYPNSFLKKPEYNLEYVHNEHNFKPDYRTHTNTDIQSRAPTNAELTGAGNENSNGLQNGSSSQSLPNAINLDTNIFQQLPTGAMKYNIEDILSMPNVQNSLANKRYMVMHPNGTIEYLNKVDGGILKQYHIVHAKRNNLGRAKDDIRRGEIDNISSPLHETSHIVPTYVPVNAQTFPAPPNVNSANNNDYPQSLPLDANYPANHNNPQSTLPNGNYPANNNYRQSTLPNGIYADNNNYLQSTPTNENAYKNPANVDSLSNNKNLQKNPENVDSQYNNNNLQKTPPNIDSLSNNKKLQNTPANVDSLSNNNNLQKNPANVDLQYNNNNLQKMLPNVDSLSNSNNLQNTPANADSLSNNDNLLKTPVTVDSLSNNNNLQNTPATVDSLSNNEHFQKTPANQDSLSNSNNLQKTSANIDSLPNNNNLQKTPANVDSLSNDNNLQKPPQNVNLPENYNNQEATAINGNYKNLQPVPVVSKKSDDSPPSVTVSPIVSSPISLVPNAPDNDKSYLQTTTNSPAVITSPKSFSSADDISTLSPLVVTDSVTDIPPVTTTTTNPVQTPSTLDTVTSAYSQKDDARNNTTSTSTSASIIDDVQTYPVTTVSPSSSVPQSDNSSRDDKTITIVKNDNNTESHSKTEVLEDNGKNYTKKATYSSITNTDVPAESDGYSPVTTGPSVQNDVNTGDTSTTSGDNSFESETDLNITVNTSDESEGDIVTISIEVSESADHADSSNDDTLVFDISTQDEGKDDSSATATNDCSKNQTNNDDNQGKNIEIDVSNIHGEPTMWFRTTNQDFINKLTSNNDTQFDVIYFFQVQSPAIVEREKLTTVYCNGTVNVEITETTWKFKDDPSPTTVKKSSQSYQSST